MKWSHIKPLHLDFCPSHSNKIEKMLKYQKTVMCYKKCISFLLYMTWIAPSVDIPNSYNFVTHIVSHNTRDKCLHEEAYCQHINT